MLNMNSRETTVSSIAGTTKVHENSIFEYASLGTRGTLYVIIKRSASDYVTFLAWALFNISFAAASYNYKGLWEYE